MVNLRENFLRRAYDLMQQGKSRPAAALVARLLKRYPNDYHAWWLFANVASTQADVIMALENVLRLKPYHERARRMLAQARASNMKLQRVQAIADDSTGDIGRVEVRCRNCGAFTTVTKDVVPDKCSFCGGSQLTTMAGRDVREVVQADLILPFVISHHECILIAQKWFSSSWLTPDEFKDQARLGFFTPLFLPFWAIDSDIRGTWKLQEDAENSDRYRAIRMMYGTRGRLYGTIRNLLHPATAQLGDYLIRHIADYDLSSDALPFHPEHTAGVAIQISEMKAFEALAEVRDKMRRILGQLQPVTTENLVSIYPKYKNEVWKPILLPAYLATYQYKNRVYKVMVNGQTGKISGQRPVDWVKVVVGVLLALIPGAALTTLTVASAEALRAQGVQGIIIIPLLVLGLGMYLAWLLLSEGFSYDNV